MAGPGLTPKRSSVLALNESSNLDLYSYQDYLIRRSIVGEGLRDRVKERYAGAALTVLEGAGAASCCGSAGECGLDSESLGVDWTGAAIRRRSWKCCPRRRARLRWDVATPRPSPRSLPGK